ncbi:MAG: hypothetical protein KDC76_10485 [Bacteroidetes bacterium]|nr:hypothetical protein [Bacteroidota bacterium]
MILRKILLVLVGYLLVQFIYRIWKVRKALKASFREMQNQQREHTPDGETRIYRNNPKPPSNNQNDGDYVDYEEVD